MDCCFFSKENVILGTKWNHTDSGVTENQTAVEESIYAFDGMLFTKQETMEPDPVTALNNWIKKMYENSVILGRDPLEDIWKAENSEPTVYCRLESLVPGPYKDTWYSPGLLLASGYIL